jgi:hypothetical protein
MKWRFAWIYGLGVAVLLGVAFWSVWASAEPATNATAVTVTNGLPRVLVKLDEHPLTFGLDQVDLLRDNTFLEQPLWKYAASLIYIALAFGVAWLIDSIVNVWLKRWAARKTAKNNEWLLDLLRGPVKVVLFVIFLNVGLNIFEWPERAQLFLSHAFIVVVACSVTYVVIKLVDLLIGLWRERMATAPDKVFADQLLPLLSKAGKVLIVIIAGLLTADNLNIRIGSALAGLSIGGLALGLAAQDTVANLFGAVAIFLDKPFKPGGPHQNSGRGRHRGIHWSAQHTGAQSRRPSCDHPEQDHGQRNHHQHHAAPQHQDGDELWTDLRHSGGESAARDHDPPGDSWYPSADGRFDHQLQSLRRFRVEHPGGSQLERHGCESAFCRPAEIKFADQGTL